MKRGGAKSKARGPAAATAAAPTAAVPPGALPAVDEAALARAMATLPLPLPIPIDEDEYTAETHTLLASMKGPTDWTNWLVRDRVLVGAYPRKRAQVRELLAVGVTSFVCLIAEDELARLEPKGSYFALTADMVRELNDERVPNGGPRIERAHLEYLHLPIHDRTVTDDARLRHLLDLLVVRFAQGRAIFVHCRGGHGRTGVVASCLLARIYGLAAYDALILCQRLHDLRPDCLAKGEPYASPQTTDQRDQVYRIVDS